MAATSQPWRWTAQPHTPVPPPAHPTYSLEQVRGSPLTVQRCTDAVVAGAAAHGACRLLAQVVRSALEEDAGGLGDVTTQAT